MIFSTNFEWKIIGLISIIIFNWTLNEMVSEINNDLGFKKEAIYKIVVDGMIDENWSNLLEGMQVTIEIQNNRTVTNIVGDIKDQSALSGMLNNLYDGQYTVISVNMLFEKK